MKKAVVIGIGVILGGCQTTGTIKDGGVVPTVVTVTKVQKERLPPLYIPPRTQLRKYSYDFPRRTDLDKIVKNTKACKAVPKEKQDDVFWTRCGQYPVDVKSNLFIGVSKNGWAAIQYNLEVLSQSERTYRRILQEENKRRATVVPVPPSRPLDLDTKKPGV